MLSDLPHSGRILLFWRVTCFQAPIFPAQISGGSWNDWRISAEDFPSAARDIPKSQTLPVETVSGPRHRVSTFPARGSAAAMPLAPSICSVNRILSGEESQVRVAGEALR